MKVYFLKFKSETFEHLKIFKVFVEIFMSTKLKTICMNNGGEYKSNEVKNYCDNDARTSYMPQQKQFNSIKHTIPTNFNYFNWHVV